MAERGAAILETDDADEFASFADGLLRDPEYACRVGRAGRDAVRARYDWSRIGEQIRAQIEAMGAAGP